MSSKFLIGKDYYPHKDTGERIRRIRGGLTQQNFSEILGIKQAQYNRYEKGRVKPPRKILEKISAYGSVSIDWILFGEKRPYEMAEFDQLLPQKMDRSALFQTMDKIHETVTNANLVKSKRPDFEEYYYNKLSSDPMSVIFKALDFLNEKDFAYVFKLMLERLASSNFYEDPYIKKYIGRILKIVDKGEVGSFKDIREFLLREMISKNKSLFTIEEILDLLEKFEKDTS